MSVVKLLYSGDVTELSYIFKDFLVDLSPLIHQHNTLSSNDSFSSSKLSNCAN